MGESVSERKSHLDWPVSEDETQNLHRRTSGEDVLKKKCVGEFCDCTGTPKEWGLGINFPRKDIDGTLKKLWISLSIHCTEKGGLVFVR